MAMKSNELGLEEFAGSHGKKANQKLKPYLVQQYLLRNSDEDHVVNADDIVEFLGRCGIDAERRSIYRDINDINKVMWLRDNKVFTSDDEEDDGITILDAEESLAADEDNSDKAIVYQKHAAKKGSTRDIIIMIPMTFDFWQSASILQNFFHRDRLTALPM